MSTGWRQLRDDRVSYTDEDPWIRERYKEDVAKRALEFSMPEQLFNDPDFEWLPGA